MYRSSNMYRTRYRSQQTPLLAPEIQQVARAVVAALNKLNLKCVLVGGVACNAYGNPRVATDIDVVVLTSSIGQEELKRQLVDTDSNFYLVASKNPYATYKVLWYKLSTSAYFSRSCKVDVLVPGIMNIPDVPLNRIKMCTREQGQGLPLMPFLPLLMLKLQAWEDHQNAPKEYLRVKQHTDVNDIAELLRIAVKSKVVLGAKERSWIPSSFVQAAERRLSSYVTFFPETAEKWKKIGFTWSKSGSSRHTENYHDYSYDYL